LKIETNLVPYNPDDLILACHNLNQIHTYLNNKFKRLHDDDKAFLFTLFDNTYAGEVIKEINSKKKSRKKMQKDETSETINPNL
jgi:hypothetical protein